MIRQIPATATLRAFDAVARRGSLARAADEMNLTHGALSHHIRGLEDRLGVRLFERHSDGMRLTPEGRALAGRVAEALRLLEGAFEDRRSPVHPSALSVSVLPAFADRWLLPRLGGFLAAHPGVEIRVRPSTALVDLGPEGIDVAIRYGAGPWPELESEFLMAERVFPVCAPGLAPAAADPGADGAAGPAALSSMVLLRNARQPWLPWFRAAGLPWPEPASGPAFEDAGLLLRAAAAGLGVALAREALVAADLAEGRLVRLFETAVEEAHGYHAVWHPRRGGRPAARAFRAWLRAEATAGAQGSPGH
jgi:LysR family glycine cleavage system transcriptional activator